MVERIFKSDINIELVTFDIHNPDGALQYLGDATIFVFSDGTIKVMRDNHELVCFHSSEIRRVIPYIYGVDNLVALNGIDVFLPDKDLYILFLGGPEEKDRFVKMLKEFGVEDIQASRVKVSAGSLIR